MNFMMDSWHEEESTRIAIKGFVHSFETNKNPIMEGGIQYNTVRTQGVALESWNVQPR